MNRCNTCFKTAIVQCAACRAVSYCGADCQKIDWATEHTVQCALHQQRMTEGMFIGDTVETYLKTDKQFKGFSLFEAYLAKRGLKGQPVSATNATDMLWRSLPDHLKVLLLKHPNEHAFTQFDPLDRARDDFSRDTAMERRIKKDNLQDGGAQKLWRWHSGAVRRVFLGLPYDARPIGGAEAATLDDLWTYEETRDPSERRLVRYSQLWVLDQKRREDVKRAFFFELLDGTTEKRLEFERFWRHSELRDLLDDKKAVAWKRNAQKNTAVGANELLRRLALVTGLDKADRKLVQQLLAVGNEDVAFDSYDGAYAQLWMYMTREQQLAWLAAHPMTEKQRADQQEAAGRAARTERYFEQQPGFANFRREPQMASYRTKSMVHWRTGYSDGAEVVNNGQSLRQALSDAVTIHNTRPVEIWDFEARLLGKPVSSDISFPSLLHQVWFYMTSQERMFWQ